MKSGYLTALRTIQMVDEPIPQPNAGELLVKIQHVGVCGSDLHFFEHGRIGDTFQVKYPFILGHESGGIVAGIGEGVKGFAIGDAVALEPGIPCGKCEACRTGYYNLCPDVQFFAAPPDVHGTFKEYITHPAQWCFKLPKGMTTLEGAMIEPLAVGMHAAAQAGAGLGQTAAVLGAGCIGLMTMLALKAKGVTTVYIADVIDMRLEKAKELGGIVIDAREENAADFVMKDTQGRGVDIVVETAGSSFTIAQTIDIARMGGTITMVGLSPQTHTSFNFEKLINREITVKSVFRYRNNYKTCVDAVGAGLIPVSKVVSHTYPFEKLQEAMDFAADHKSECVKVAIEF